MDINKQLVEVFFCFRNFLITNKGMQLRQKMCSDLKKYYQHSFKKILFVLEIIKILKMPKKIIKELQKLPIDFFNITFRF